MKQGLIEARVNNLNDISLRIKGFVQQKSALVHSPLQQTEFFGLSGNSQNKAKRSLTDWRQLYSRNKNKIIPRHTVYPATADGQRIRCTMTGQCNRRKIHSSANRKASQGEIFNKTRELKDEKQIEQKRETLIEFAFAQKCYEKEVLKQISDSAKDNKFYNLSIFDKKRRNYWRVNDYLGKISRQQSANQKQKDPTEDFIKRNNDTLQKMQVKPYNNVKIKDICKINNLRFLSQAQEQKILKQKMSATHGLRFYQRQ